MPKYLRTARGMIQRAAALLNAEESGIRHLEFH